MISSLLVEAAIRSVLLALAVWIGLRAFNVRNVLAQKAAWGLVLASALAMPVVLPMTEHWSVLPANVRVVIPADPETLLEELQARIQAKTPAKTNSPAAAVVDGESASQQQSSGDAGRSSPQNELSAQPPVNLMANQDAGSQAQASVADRYPAPTVSQSVVSVAESQQPAPMPAWRQFSLLKIAGLAYLAVAGVLCMRLLYGLLMAMNVWRSARPATLARSPLTDGLRLRVSDSISSPVTIGSAVVLPSDFCEWDSEKLRIVLAHERSHIRQGDFYLQLLAGVYSAVVWFSPLGWWLKHTLSDLAEAISDRAGLEEAADRTSYAQVLLEFAAAPRPTTIGVAMARHGSLSRRIERLLNDVSFSQAFAGTRRGLLAVLVVPIALFVATALVRVEAATGQEPQEQAQVVLPMTGVVVPQEPIAPAEPQEGASKPEQAETPAPAVAPQAPSSGVTPKAAEKCDCADHILTIPSPAVAPVAPAGVPAPPAHVPAVPGVAPVPPAHAPAVVILRGQPTIATLALSPKLSMKTPLILVPHVAYAPQTTLAIIAPSHVGFGEGYGYGVGQNSRSGSVSSNNNGKHSGYHWYSSNGESYAVIRGGDSEHMSFSGNWMQGQREEIEKARKQAGGKDILWFSHEGKSYVVDDPATLAQIEAMYGPIDELGRQQEALGKKQEALGKQQEDLGKQQEAASVPTPDMSKEIAKIEEAMAKLKASQGKNMTQEQFSDMQEKLGELQSRIGEMQGQIGEKQGEFGARMGELGEKMGELGAQQGELGARQGKLAEQADQRVKSIIEESLKNGKARPVQ